MIPHPPDRTGGAAKNSGFTLIELLTVIAIIGILAAIIIPTVGAVRKTARATQCLSQVRQIGVGYLLYANDNKGKCMPIGVTPDLWMQVLDKSGLMPRYDGNNQREGIWRCPETLDADRTSISSYGVCNENQKYTLNSIANPSRTWMVGEVSRFPKTGLDDFSYGWYAIPLPTGSGYQVTLLSGNQIPGARHSNNTKANVCMFDGHVKSLTYPELNAKDGTNWRYFTYK